MNDLPLANICVIRTTSMLNPNFIMVLGDACEELKVEFNENHDKNEYASILFETQHLKIRKFRF